jgi:hypothetical protein
MTTGIRSTRDSLTVWHDGGCPLCRREIALMRRLDRQHAISFIDVRHDANVCPIDRNALFARFHATEDGRLLSGGGIRRDVARNSASAAAWARGAKRHGPFASRACLSCFPARPATSAAFYHSS